MKSISIRTPRAIDELPYLVAGYIKDQEFVAVQSEPPAFLQQDPQFFLGAQILQMLPEDAIIQLDDFEQGIIPNQLRVRLIYRRESENFRRLHTLSREHPSSYEWMALEPGILPGNASRNDWIRRAKFMNDSFLSFAPTVEAVDLPDLPLPPTPEPVTASCPAPDRERGGPSGKQTGGPSPQEEKGRSSSRESAEEKAKLAFRLYLSDHGECALTGAHTGAIGAPPVPDTSIELMRCIFEENYRYYSDPVSRELEQLLNSSHLGPRAQTRAALLLRHGFRRRAPDSVAFDHTPLTGQPLIGRTQAQQALDQILSRIEQTRQPQSVLLHAPAGHGAGCLIRRLARAAGSRTVVWVDAGETGISLVGTSPIYDQATEGNFLHEAFWADIIVVRNFNSAWYSRTSDKDSAYPALTGLISRHVWTDKFLGVELPVSACLILVLTQEYPQDMERSCSGLFNYTIDLSADYTLEEKCQILQERAAKHGLTMTGSDARTVVLEYAPLSLPKAAHLVDRLTTRMRETFDPAQVRQILGDPVLSPEEKLAGRYGHCRESMRPAARDLAEEQMGILCNSTDFQARDHARRVLGGILDCLPVPEQTRPDRRQIRAALDRDLIGMERVKDAVSTWAASCRGQRRGLLLVGPPGVAKTAVSSALSRALGFGDHLVRLDMSHLTKGQLCGTGRAYGSVPGLLAEYTQRYKGRQIPFLFDELDKASTDVLYTLLELLDSGLFSDNAYGLLDQSHRPLLFTANELGSIPRPLLDRLMVVPVAPYTLKQKIALMAFLWQRRCPGAEPLSRELCETLVRWWGITGGARDLQQITEKLSAAYEKGSWDPEEKDFDSLRTILGKEAFCPPPLSTLPGMSYALAVTNDGSGILTPVQAVACDAEENFGLGSNASMTDSASLARFLARRLAGKNARPAALAMDAAPGERSGPSAGLSEFVALYALFQGYTLPGVAASGELLAQGQVRPVGGLRSKIDAAVRGSAFVRYLILPEGNREDADADQRRDLEEAGVQLCFVSHVGEAAHLLNQIAARPAVSR